MGTPAITADAVGITSNGSKHVGSVVEQLLAPDAVGADDRVVHVPVHLIEAHPHNRRIVDEDVADLVAELKAGSRILNPLGVTAAADWNANRPGELKEIGPRCYIITAGGHRRLRAAELAGLPTVPCIVRADFAGAEGRKAALLENLHRQNLDAFQEAEAFAELVGEPYKMSQRDLAALIDCNQSHVSKRLKLLRLPTTVREAVRINTITIDDAVALAGVVDNQPVFDTAWQQVQQWRRPGRAAVANAQADHDRTVARRKTLDRLEAEGVRIIDRRPAWYPMSKTEPTRLVELKLDETKHASEPCHVFHVDDGGKASTVCEKPGRHVKTGDSKLKVRKSIEEQLSSRGGGDAEAKKRAERRELKKLWPARTAIARQLVHGQTDLDAATERELLTRGTLGNLFHGEGASDTWKVLVDLTGLTDLPGYPNEDATDQLIRRLSPPVLHRAVALGYFEGRLRSTWRQWGSDGRYYLDLLAAHGYEVSRLEKTKLGKPAATTTADADVVDDSTNPDGG